VLDLEDSIVSEEMIEERVGEHLDTKPASVASKKAVEEHFTSNDKRYSKKADLIARCKELNIPHMKDGSRAMTVPEIWRSVEIFFSEWHKRDGSSPHESSCYVKEKQNITRSRAETSAKKRAKTKNGSEKNNNKSKKKILSAEDAIKLFPKEGFYIGTGDVLRCYCSHKAGKWITNFICYIVLMS